MKKIALIYDKKNEFISSFETFLISKNIEIVSIKSNSFRFLPSFIQDYFFAQKIKKISKEFITISFIPKIEADVYFYTSIFSKSTQHLKSAKKIIVQTKRDKYELSSKRIVDVNNVNIVYPSWKKTQFDVQELKKSYFDKLQIENLDLKIILHITTNIQKSGVNQFLQTISAVESTNFVSIIACGSKQKVQLDFLLSGSKFGKNIKLITFDDDNEVQKLLTISDIFIYPSKVKSFSSYIPLAMGLKNVVFVTSVNKASEIVDYFATIQGENDNSASHKIDALLSGNDLTSIQTQNYEIALEYEESATFKKIYEILESL